MYEILFGHVAIVFLAIPARCQITGTYPVQLTAATGAPDAGDGNQLSSYPQCAVSFVDYTAQHSPGLMKCSKIVAIYSRLSALTQAHPSACVVPEVVAMSPLAKH